MARVSVKFCEFSTKILLLLALTHHVSVECSSWYALNENTQSNNYAVRLLELHRTRRAAEVALSATSNAPAPTLAPPTSPSAAASTLSPPPSPKASAPTLAPLPSPNATSNKTMGTTVPESTTEIAHESTTHPSAPTTTPGSEMHNVGVNGSGIHKDVKLPKAKPTVPDESLATATSADEYKQVVKMVNPEHQLDNLTYVNHTFYNSTFIGEPGFFDELWANITNMKFEIHPILSSSHRRATTVSLSFDFPFYGKALKNVTVATGGFIYMGDHVHNWLAATQYIAPLMANFDTRSTNDSSVKIADDGTNFTVVWENVSLQNYENESFTFAVVLRTNGDIIFAYKDIPIAVQYIDDKEHPVKVGISDAFLQDRLLFSKRRKTIYEYHRVSYMDHNITSKTIIRLHALPTCLLYDTCQSCINHNTAFNCTWCPATKRCSSGVDRMKQDWFFRNCDKNFVAKESDCDAAAINGTNENTGDSSVTSDKNNPFHNVIMKHDYTPPIESKGMSGDVSKRVAVPGAPAAHSSLGGVVVAFLIVVLITSAAGWVFYAYKNPHTRSGQFLIKYRPMAWSWKRGEARYTAATIHM